MRGVPEPHRPGTEWSPSVCRVLRAPGFFGDAPAPAVLIPPVGICTPRCLKTPGTTRLGLCQGISQLPSCRCGVKPDAFSSRPCYLLHPVPASSRAPNHTNLVFSHLFSSRFPPGLQLAPLSISGALFFFSLFPPSFPNGIMEMGHGTAAGGPHGRAGTALSALASPQPVPNPFPVPSSRHFRRALSKNSVPVSERLFGRQEGAPATPGAASFRAGNGAERELSSKAPCPAPTTSPRAQGWAQARPAGRKAALGRTFPLQKGEGA